jgi:hypothetical protein
MNHRRLKLIIQLSLFTVVSFLCYSILSVSENSISRVLVNNTLTISTMLIVWLTCILLILYQLVHIRTADKVSDMRADQINQLVHQRLRKIYFTRSVYVGLFALVMFILRVLTDKGGLLSINHPLFGLFSETIFSTFSVIALITFLICVLLYVRHRFSSNGVITESSAEGAIPNQAPSPTNQEIDRQIEDMKIASRYKMWSYIALPLVAVHVIYIGLVIYEFVQGGGIILLLLPFLLPFTFILFTVSVFWLHSYLQYKNGK